MKKLFSKLALVGIMLAVAQASWGSNPKIKKYEVFSKVVGAGKVYAEPLRDDDRADNCYSYTGTATKTDITTWGTEDSYKAAIEKADYSASNGYTCHYWTHAEATNVTGADFKGFYISKTELSEDEQLALIDKDLSSYTMITCTETDKSSSNWKEDTQSLAQDADKGVWTGEIAMDDYNSTEYSESGLERKTVYANDGDFVPVYIYAVYDDHLVKVRPYIGPKFMGVGGTTDAQDGSVNSGHAFGTYTLSPAGAKIGEEVTLTATPNPGFAFSHWTDKFDDDTNVLSTDATWTTTASNRIYYPVFKVAPVTIGSVGYATYSVATKLILNDANTTEGLEGYAITAKADNGELTLTKMKAVTEGFALLLKGEAKDYNISYKGLVMGNYIDADGESTVNNNLLQGTPNGTFTVPTEDDGYKYYVLADKSQGVGFYLAAGGLVVPQNKAYLKIAKDSGAKTFYGFDELATGLVAPEATTETGNVEMYNIAGQRIAHPVKGINIINGKKVVVK